MRASRLLIVVIFLVLCRNVAGQGADRLSIQFNTTDISVIPGKIVNLAFRVQNHSEDTLDALPVFSHPESWNIVTRPFNMQLKPNALSLGIVSFKVPNNHPVGKFAFQVELHNVTNDALLAVSQIEVQVKEVENITLQLVDKTDHVMAGENISANYLIQNLGNTEKKIFLNTGNCDIVGSPDLKLQPGESAGVKIVKATSEESIESRKESFTLRAQINDRILESVYASSIVLPSKKAKQDLFFRFPVKASATYLSTNRNNDFQSAYQFEIEGRGTLDPQGKHRLGFLARWPNNADLSFLGLYDQYYLYYSQKNVDLFLGEKSYNLTPLTENSRFGRGAEAKFTLNNGLAFGAMYVKPRFYEEIEDELAAFSEFNFGKQNSVGVYLLSKKYLGYDDPAQLISVTSQLNPFESTSLELEYSRGEFNEQGSNAWRAGLNSRFSIFQLSGIYYDAGKYYPGYYTNSRFYSANAGARISEKLSLTVNVREDFNNAQLDTFFVVAPYSRSFQGGLNYRIGSESSVKLYWRETERKDRLSLQKFHYTTDSWNLQFSQRLKRFNYSLTGELGETTNYLLADGENKQNSYRVSTNLTYQFNTRNSIRLFGHWSNINQFVSDDQRSLMAGLSASSRITRNLRMNFYLQNAYDIDDYYRNRNLMQFNLDYSFLKRHTISLRSFYTIFKSQTSDPEFTLSATYSYNLGIPLKQVIKAGKIEGRITDQQGNAVEGIYIKVLSEIAVSDKAGEFEFKAVPPGKQLLTIDRDKLKIDETTNIRMPLELDVLENEVSQVNIQILKGARIKGQLKLGEASLSALDDMQASAANIVVELKTDFESYRITTDKSGSFSFPLVRPGTVVFRIYANTIPAGYQAAQSSYEYELLPGEEREIDLVLSAKKKNIIFKPSGTAMSVKGGVSTVKVASTTKPEKAEAKPYYTIQIGAFKKPLPKDADFLSGHTFYFEKQIDNFHKYFVGKYDSEEAVLKQLKVLKLRYRNAFPVVVVNDEIMTLNQFNTRIK
ncbi:hypothetical protein [Maribellus sediminis]|uniref:hypothetical protein n=1 Tax=Maribellus sediminis TaxID=2696285 RepID=UPI0014319DB7|nr:hypothetical protein [Maribellus sediminis]